MIPVLQLDPATLTLWCDTTLIASGPNGKALANLVKKAVLGAPTVVEDFRTIDDSVTKGRAANLISCVWHEKRHFIDLLLSNYGAFRIREYFKLYMNIPHLLHEAIKGEHSLVFPLDVACDPFRMKLLGVDTVGKNLKRQANNFRQHKRMLTDDRRVLEFPSVGAIETGGEALLEAFAYLTQITVLQELVGYDAAAIAQNDMQASDPDIQRLDQKYRWVLVAARGAGLLPHSKISDGIEELKPDILSAIMLAALACRKWGQEQANGSHMSGYRLVELFEKLKGRGVEFQHVTPDVLWEEVNKAAKKLWGRTVVEEIDVDYDHEEKFVESFRNAGYDVSDVARVCLEDYHHLRGRLITLLKEEPESFVSVNSFVHKILPLANPVPIFAYPSGKEIPLKDEWKNVLGVSDTDSNGNTVGWSWAITPKDHNAIQDYHLAVTRPDCWLSLTKELTPVAKLMMNGFSHRTMLGPELIIDEQKLADSGCKYVIDPLFRLPPDFNNAEFFWRITRLAEAYCDLCRSIIHKGGGFVHSPWIWRASAKNEEIATELLGGGKIGHHRFFREWAAWLICEECETKFVIHLV